MTTSTIRRPRRGIASTERAVGAHSVHNGAVPSPAPVELDEPGVDDAVATDRPWVVLVWNDPINLMSYVTLVLQQLFGYSKEKATKLMLDVHHKGRAVVSSGNREKAELDVFRLHDRGLWATMQQDD
jgi:ATP-dependent Clp protease adaptor protein ClpS